MVNHKNSGYVYCLSNPSYGKSVYKIGYTKEKNPNNRLKSLFKTGVPTPFVLVIAKKVDNVINQENKLHLELDEYRINSQREFFHAPLNIVETLFENLKGTYWNDDVAKDKVIVPRLPRPKVSYSLKKRRLRREVNVKIDYKV